MDLTKKIELYYGQAPIEAETESMQKLLSRENEYCALYVQNDVPADVHNWTNEEMLTKFGVHSDFAKKNGYVRPFTQNCETGLAGLPSFAGKEDITATNLRNSGYKVGGTFFGMSIAETILNEFQRLGYEVIKKHD